jgi:flagella basal body P-ring formation protein FlgA
MIYTFFKKITQVFIILSLFSGMATSADRLTGKDIRNIVIERAKEDGIDLSPIIAPQKVFDACETNLNVTPLFGDWKTTQVSCSAPNAWKLNLRSVLSESEIITNSVVKIKHKPIDTALIKPKIIAATPANKTPAVKKVLKKRTVELFDYVVLLEPATKGTILSDPKYLTTRSFQYKVRGGFTTPEQILGRKLKAFMPEGKPLLARHLATVYIVEKNDIIGIVLKRSGIKVSSEGVALSNGQLGEIILVSNVDTGVKLKAKIKSSHEAEIITKQSN